MAGQQARLLAKVAKLQEENTRLRLLLSEAQEEKQTIINICRNRLSDIEMDLEWLEEFVDAIENSIDVPIATIQNILKDTEIFESFSRPSTITINSTSSRQSSRLYRSFSLSDLTRLSASQPNGSTHSSPGLSYLSARHASTPYSFAARSTSPQEHCAVATRPNSNAELPRNKSSTRHAVTDDIEPVQWPTNQAVHTPERHSQKTKSTKSKIDTTIKSPERPAAPKKPPIQNAKFFKHRHVDKTIDISSEASRSNLHLPSTSRGTTCHDKPHHRRGFVFDSSSDETPSPPLSVRQVQTKSKARTPSQPKDIYTFTGDWNKTPRRRGKKIRRRAHLYASPVVQDEDSSAKESAESVAILKEVTNKKKTKKW